jgi:hypothetical protein
MHIGFESYKALSVHAVDGHHRFDPKMDAACFSETPISSYKTARCHRPEDHNINVDVHAFVN